MENMQRRTFPTTVKTLDGKSAPTEAELDRMLFELVRDKFGADVTEATPEPAVPTDAELRRKAAELGIALPPTYLDTVRAEAKSEMVACLRGTDEQAGGR